MSKTIFDERTQDENQTDETQANENDDIFSNEENTDAPEENADTPEEEETKKTKGRTGSDLLSMLSSFRDIMSRGNDDDDDDDDDDDVTNLTADELHNRAVDKARKSKYRLATNICIDGLKRFPRNIDLIADIIQYSSDVGDMETAEKYYSLLKEKIPFRCWNWRAFSFSFDYLMRIEPVANEQECRELIAKYKEYLPYEEKAYVAESELEDALGNHDKSMAVLEKAIHTLTNACQCALRLMDMQMARGLFQEARTTSDYGKAASAETQPSVNIPYFFYSHALANDFLLHEKVYKGETVSKDEVSALTEEYNMLLDEFPQLMSYASTLMMRIKMLKFVRAE